MEAAVVENPEEKTTEESERSAAQKATALENLKKAAEAKAAKKVLAAYVAPDEGVPEALGDMQHAYRNSDKRHDRTAGQKVARGFLVKDAKGFLAMMRDMEEGWRRAIKVGSSSVKDVGLEKSLEMAEALLKESIDEAQDRG